MESARCTSAKLSPQGDAVRSRKIPRSEQPRGSQDSAAAQASGQPNSSARGNHSTALLLMCTVLSALVAGGAFYAMFQGAIIHRTPSTKDPTASARMEDLFRALWNVGNNSLNPCTDFYEYACQRFNGSLPGDLFSSGMTLNEVLQGLSRTEPGRVLFTYFRSCLSAHWKHENALQSAVRALLQVVYVGADTTPLNVFVLTLKLNLAYGIHLNLLIYHNIKNYLPPHLTNYYLDFVIGANHSSKPELYVVASPGTFSPEALAYMGVEPLMETALKELQEVIEINVSLPQLKDLAERLHEVPHEDTLFASNTSLLRYVALGVPLRLWKDTVEQFTGLKMSELFIHSAFDVLQHRFGVLMNRKFQPVTAAFIFTEAAVALCEGNMWPRAIIEEYYEFCKTSASELNSLWFLNSLLSFSPNAEHNQAALSAFRALIDTVVAEVKEVLDPADAILAERKLLNITLFLPYHLFPMDISLPTLGNNYLLNIIYLRGHRLTNELYRLPSAVPLGLTSTYIEGERDFVYLPLGLYTAVKLDHTVPLLRMAMFGLALADDIWSVLLETNWTMQTKEALGRLDCRGDEAASGTQKLERPELALRSCIRALRAPGWHELRLYWGTWRTSLSRLFFRLMALYYFCNDSIGHKASSRRQLAAVMSRSPDFMEAFQCPQNHVKPQCPM